MRRFQFFILNALMLISSAFACFAYYHPDEGRWISRDPIEEVGFHVVSGHGWGKNRRVLNYMQEIVYDLRGDSSELSQMFSILITYDDKLLNEASRVDEQDRYTFVFNSPVDLYDILGLLTYDQKLEKCRLQYEIDKSICHLLYANICNILKWPACMEKARANYYACVLKVTSEL